MTLGAHSDLRQRISVVLAAVGLVLLGAGCESMLGGKGRAPVVAKWGRFEQAFKSSVDYSNAVQEARLTIVFTSPLGTTQQVDGFWDGGKVWRVRFAPDQVGRWTYRTVCSDASNRGLHDRAGEFICGAVMGFSRFQRHGPVRVARDHHHFEHADGTAFFWLADTAWNGARLSVPTDWEIYALTREHQGFSVVQWAVGPGIGAENQSAFTGTERIAINPDFFQRLDAQVTTLSRAGLLAAITPLLELGGAADPGARLPEDQAILLVRYIVARWGAEPVVWLLAFEGGGQARNVERWQRIGQAVFGEGAHAPVVVFPGQTEWVLDRLRHQSWVDAFAYQSVTGVSEDALRWAFEGPLAGEWKKEPARPLVAFMPLEDTPRMQPGKRFTSDDVRHAAYWSLLTMPPAGVSYGAQAVAQWEVGFGPATTSSMSSRLPAWRTALLLPGADQMNYLAKFMGGIDFWQLRPEPGAVAEQPGKESAGRFIAAAATENKALTLAYVPEDRTAHLSLKALPSSPRIEWYNPRTGERTRAVAVVGENECEFPTPGAGDWLLIVQSGRR